MLNKSDVKRQIEVINYQLWSRAKEFKLHTLMVKKWRRKEVAISLADVNVELSVTWYGYGYDYQDEVTPIFRISTQGHLLSGGFGLFANDISEQDKFFKDTWRSKLFDSSMEISFLFEETAEIVTWILGNIPIVNTPFPFETGYDGNVAIGIEPSYAWTDSSEKAIQRKYDKYSKKNKRNWRTYEGHEKRWLLQNS